MILFNSNSLCMKRLITLVAFCILSFVAKASPDSLGYSYPCYPSEVKHLGLQQQYDITRWYMYCILCDREIKFTKETGEKEKISYGLLPLKFDHVEIRKDTVEIDCYFYYKDILIDGVTTRNYSLWGLVFKGKSNKPIQFSTQSTGRYYMAICDGAPKDCQVRELNPLQPEVIKYIKQNKEKLDPWFRKQAQKRGVIK